MTILNEGLDYLDLEGFIDSKVTIDEYAAKMGKDKDVVTLTFAVNSKLAADDLVTWFERGYDFVVDASVSDGEIQPGKYLVFVEMERRSRVPERVCKMLSELDTLTGLKLHDWTVGIKNEDYEASEDIIREKISLNPNEYKMDIEAEQELNEYREIANLPSKPTQVQDTYIKNIKALAGF
jgi:hypothetical protein